MLSFHISLFFSRTGKKGDCTISMKDSDFMDMVTGKIGGQKARHELSLSVVNELGH